MKDYDNVQEKIELIKSGNLSKKIIVLQKEKNELDVKSTNEQYIEFNREINNDL